MKNRRTADPCQSCGFISWAENIPFFPEESHNGRLEYVLLENNHT